MITFSKPNSAFHIRVFFNGFKFGLVMPLYGDPRNEWINDCLFEEQTGSRIREKTLCEAMTAAANIITEVRAKAFG